jgi:hypothetical protein
MMLRHDIIFTFLFIFYVFQEALTSLKKNLQNKWDFISMQAEEQVIQGAASYLPFLYEYIHIKKEVRWPHSVVTICYGCINILKRRALSSEV